MKLGIGRKKKINIDHGNSACTEGMAGDRRPFLLCLGRNAGLVLFCCISGAPGTCAGILDCFLIRDLGIV